MKSMRLAVILLTCLGALTGCAPAALSVPADLQPCKVVRFEAVGEEPVCSVLCQWENNGASQMATGFESQRPVDCSWFGKTVRMVR